MALNSWCYTEGNEYRPSVDLIRDLVDIVSKNGCLLLNIGPCADGTINPLIGSAGVSAVPMAARVSQREGQKADPGNFLLMHAMGPNVAGVIGSAVAAGVFLKWFM